MKRITLRATLCILAVMSACVMLAACGKKTETDSTPSVVTPQEPAATPEPTLPPYEANVLTGEPKGEGMIWE
ncbi:MAG: hypothetical protein PHO10_10875 [Gemmiger sp.]|nr:hypothetical protein [Gemmiger sp.]